MDVALATCAAHPSLDPYDRPLLGALAGLGLDARAAAWDDASVDWGAARAVVIRSAWDSHLRRDEFLAWADATAAATRLHNPAGVIRWNMHKGYLRAFEARGVPVTPTLWVARGGRADLETAFAAAGSVGALVLKPAVSASACETFVFTRAELDAAQREADRLAAAHDLLVQPYLRAFETEGERSYVFVDGTFSHAVRRPPTLSTARRGFDRPSAFAPEGRHELALAEAVLEAAGGRLLYARVDIATGNDGSPCVQELELNEPCLFLSLDPAAPGRLARAIAAAL